MADYFNKVLSGTTRPVATTLAAQKLSGATTASLVATTGWDNTTKVHGIMYRTDAGTGEKVAGSQIDWKASLSGTTLSNFEVTAGTDDTYAIGTTVELAPTAAWGDDIATGILQHADQDGTLKSGAVDNAAVLADNVVETAKIADSNVTTAKLADDAVTVAKEDTIVVVKGSNESVTSSTTLQNDDALLFTAVANTTYMVEMLFSYDSATTGDLKATFSVPSGATGYATYNTQSNGTNPFSSGADSKIEETVVLEGPGAGTQTTVLMKGILVAAGTGGTVNFQWAQNASSGTATTIFANSYLMARKIA